MATAVNTVKEKKPFSIGKWDKEQKRTTGSDLWSIYYYPIVTALCIYIFTIWKDGTV